MQSQLEWRPHKGPQEQFLKVNVYEALYGGAKGGGKTDALVIEALDQVKNPRYRGIILRRTFPRLQEVIDRSYKYYLPLNAKFFKQEHRWIFPSGAVINLGHIQREEDKYNYQGHEFHFEGFDQLEEFTETQYLFLIAQNRTADPSLKCYVRSTANPGNIGHTWVKRRFVEGREPGKIYWTEQETSYCFIPAKVYDNPSLMDNDPNYIKRLQMLPPDERRALLEGDWDIFAGQFFGMWRNAVHVREKPFNDEFRVFLSGDYGYEAPACVYWWQVDYDGRIHAYRELYKEKLAYDAFAEEIIRMTPKKEWPLMEYGAFDPAIWGDQGYHRKELHGETGAETMNAVFEKHRFPLKLVRADNRRIPGWGRMKIMLAGEPRMTFSPVCLNAVRTIPALIHDDVNVEDVDTDGEDHAGDSCRYAVASRPEPTMKAPEVRDIDETRPKDLRQRIEEAQLARQFEGHKALVRR